jgi:hypothetical protein
VWQSLCVVCGLYGWTEIKTSRDYDVDETSYFLVT